MGHHHWPHRNKKDYKKIAWTKHADKLGNLGEMYRFLERQRLLKLVKRKR